MNDAVAVDIAKCTGCGLCVRMCPSDALSLDGNTAHVKSGCILCGHCEALCPEEAIRIARLGPGGGDFAAFDCPDQWMEFGGTDPAELARLMRSRRSCRAYSARPVEASLLEDLVRFAVSAPSGTSSQAWTFTLLPDRDSVMTLGRAVAEFFRGLNRTAERGWLRFLLRLVGRTELDWYWREYYPRVQGALDEWDDNGADRLFHGAPAAVIVGSRPGASCPAEDALLATQNMLLGAHALGLGTCLIGYAVEAMRRAATVQTAVGVGAKETVHAVVAVGWPTVSFARQARRKPFVMRTFLA